MTLGQSIKAAVVGVIMVNVVLILWVQVLWIVGWAVEVFNLATNGAP